MSLVTGVSFSVKMGNTHMNLKGHRGKNKEFQNKRLQNEYLSWETTGILCKLYLRNVLEARVSGL